MWYNNQNNNFEFCQRYWQNSKKMRINMNNELDINTNFDKIVNMIETRRNK